MKRGGQSLQSLRSCVCRKHQIFLGRPDHIGLHCLNYGNKQESKFMVKEYGKKNICQMKILGILMHNKKNKNNHT